MLSQSPGLIQAYLAVPVQAAALRVEKTAFLSTEFYLNPLCEPLLMIDLKHKGGTNKSKNNKMVKQNIQHKCNLCVTSVQRNELKGHLVKQQHVRVGFFKTYLLTSL